MSLEFLWYFSAVANDRGLVQGTQNRTTRAIARPVSLQPKTKDSNEVQHVVRNIHGKVATLSGTTNALMAFELGEAETLLQEGVHEAAILRAITEEARAWRQAAESKPC